MASSGIEIEIEGPALPPDPPPPELLEVIPLLDATPPPTPPPELLDAMPPPAPPPELLDAIPLLLLLTGWQTPMDPPCASHMNPGAQLSTPSTT